MKIPRASLALACLWLALGASKSRAADDLTLGRALERAVAANPSLAALAAEAEAARARATRESLPPPMILGADVENVAGGGELRGFDNAESTLRISRTFELGGKRAGRRALGDAEIAQAGHALHSAALELRALTTERFIDVVADQERLALATEHLALAQRTRIEVARVVELARNPETDLHAAEIALADAELDVAQAAHELGAARVSLAMTWGERQPEFNHAVMALDTLPEIEAFEALVARLPASASLLTLKLETDVAAARERLAASEAKPDLTVNLGVRRLEAFDDQALVAGVSLPLGSGSRARLAMAESRALSNAMARRREAQEAETYRQLFKRHRELSHARAEFRVLTDSMIPKAEQALALATRGFEMGRFPFATLSQAQQSLFELRRRRIDTAARFQALIADMQRLVAAGEVP
jgi:cobalt-zinc-cadmium efflux system outer membrane protein